MAPTSPSTTTPESRDLGEWRQVGHTDPDEEEVGQRQRWKGKSKDTHFGGGDAEMGNGGMNSMDEERVGTNGSYPPLSEEAAEEREVVEVSPPAKSQIWFLILLRYPLGR